LRWLLCLVLCKGLIAQVIHLLKVVWVKDAVHGQHCTTVPLAIDGTHSVFSIHSDVGIVSGGGVSSVQKVFVVRVNGIAVLVIVHAGLIVHIKFGHDALRRYSTLHTLGRVHQGLGQGLLR